MTTPRDLTPDIHLAEQCIAGCNAAWTQLVTRYTGSLLSLIRRDATRLQVQRGYLPEDMLQEFWMTLYRRLHKYNGRSPLGYWLRLELMGRMGDKLRTKGGHLVQVSSDLLTSEASDLSTPDRVMELHQLRLTRRQKDTLRARYSREGNPLDRWQTLEGM